MSCKNLKVAFKVTVKGLRLSSRGTFFLGHPAFRQVLGPGMLYILRLSLLRLLLRCLLLRCLPLLEFCLVVGLHANKNKNNLCEAPFVRYICNFSKINEKALFYSLYWVASQVALSFTSCSRTKNFFSHLGPPAWNLSLNGG